MTNRLEFLGLSEAAEIFGVSRQVIANWRARYHDFPKPVAELKSGPVWHLEDIIEWGRQNNISFHIDNIERRSETKEAKDMKPAITVALVNMKGGVGKSTLTANLGWYCAYYEAMRVLLVDLDPQFNLSQYTLGPSKYENHISNNRSTVLELFEQGTPSAVSGVPRRRPTPDDIIVHIRDFHAGGKLDLLPSKLELAWTLKNPTDKAQLLNNFLDLVRQAYNLILIDCAPTESMLTTAAYLTSDHVLVPVRPEFLSTIGLPLLVRSLDDFRDLHNKSVDVLGIVFNASGEKREHDRSRAFVSRVANQYGWYVFENEVTYSDSYPTGSRAGTPIFLTDYARSWKIDDFKAVAKEFMGRLGI